MIMLSETDLAGAAPASPPEPPFLMPAPRQARILVVDDEPMITQQFEHVFTSLGYTVEAFTDPFAARSRFLGAPGSFDVMISDFTMPGLDGSALARAVLAVRPQLPLLIYSGFLTEAAADKLVQIGVRDILLKPTSLSVITRQVARHLAA